MIFLFSLLASCSDHVPLVRPGSFHFTLLWLTEKRKIWGRRFGGKRGSNNHHPATSRHDASAGASINTHRKCFPRRPLWANQSRTPLVQSSLSVSHPSDNPAPSRLQCNCLALQPAHTHSTACLYWVMEAKQGNVLFLLFFPLALLHLDRNIFRISFFNWFFVMVINILWTSCANKLTCFRLNISGEFYLNYSQLTYIMYSVKCWGSVLFQPS